MKFLAINTSQEYLTVIAQNGEKIKSIHLSDCSFKHSVTLMKSVEDALCATNLSLKDLDFIACVVGAGSFTGIRIGIATVKGLCAPFDIPALSLTAFDTLAYDNLVGRRLAVIDAKHDNFYICGYDGYDISIPPQFIDSESLSKISSGYTLISSTKIDDLDTKIVDPANGLLNAIRKKSSLLCKADDLAPLYLRQSQAEEGR